MLVWATHIQSSQCLKFHVEKIFLKYLLCKDFVSLTTLGILQYGELESWLKTCSNMVERSYTFVKTFLICISQTCTWEAFENYTSHIHIIWTYRAWWGKNMGKGCKSRREWTSAAKQCFPFMTEQLTTWYPRDRIACAKLAWWRSSQSKNSTWMGNRLMKSCLIWGAIGHCWILGEWETSLQRCSFWEVTMFQLMAWHPSTYRQH